MQERKRSRIVLISAGKPSHLQVNESVNRPDPGVLAAGQEEEQFLRKYLKLADIALSTRSKPERKKLA